MRSPSMPSAAMDVKVPFAVLLTGPDVRAVAYAAPPASATARAAAATRVADVSSRRCRPVA
jgi:hypothetical protein